MYVVFSLLVRLFINYVNFYSIVYHVFSLVWAAEAGHRLSCI